MNFIKMVIPIILACFCNACANTFWKIQFSRNKFTIDGISSIIKTFLSYNIIIGVLFYVVSMLIFFYLLSNYKLSEVVPLTALTYIFNILSAYYIFNEKISTYSIVGTVIIVTGVIVLSQNPVTR